MHPVLPGGKEGEEEEEDEGREEEELQQPTDVAWSRSSRGLISTNAPYWCNIEAMIKESDILRPVQ